MKIYVYTVLWILLILAYAPVIAVFPVLYMLPFYLL